MNTLADGVYSYVAGESSWQPGFTADTVKYRTEQVQSAISQLGLQQMVRGATTEDLQAASKALAAGTAQMKAALGTEEVKV